MDGNPLTLRCSNYFGFDNGQTMFDGLWAGGSALTQDFETVLHRAQVREYAAQWPDYGLPSLQRQFEALQACLQEEVIPAHISAHHHQKYLKAQSKI